MRLRVTIWIVLAVVASSSVACGFGSSEEEQVHVGWPVENFRKGAFADPGEFRSGGPGKDGIPAVDAPEFISINDADRELHEREPVIVVQHGKVSRAYPLSILLWHEIVNDIIDGRPIAVTFCPLCNAAIVFDRRNTGRTLDFGTTGLLRKSDLVMYDRQTQSWWQQFTGECLVGKLAGSKLQVMPSSLVSFAEFRSAYPDGQVLSRNTGHRRHYGTNPYQYYDSLGNRPFMYAGPIDSRLPPLERVLGIIVGGEKRAYPHHVLARHPIISDNVAAVPVVVFATGRLLSVLDAPAIAQSKAIPAPRAFLAQVDGKTLSFSYSNGNILDVQSRSVWNTAGQCVAGPLKGKALSPITTTPSFAFAWLAFYPKSTIYAFPRP